MSSELEESLSLRHALRRMMVASVFASAFGFITGAALTRYAQTLGLTPFGFGILASLPFLTALAQLPTSYAVERYGYRKAVALWTCLAHRLLWLAIAAIPWIIPRAWWWLGLVGLVAASSTLAHTSAPAGTAWQADLIPSAVRGRYFSIRNQVSRLIGLPAGLLVGWALDRAQIVSVDALLRTISIALVIAAAFGIADVALYRHIPDRWHRPRGEGLAFWEIVRQPLRDRHFRYFLAYTATLTFGTGYIGTFCWLYVLDVVKATNTEATLMCMVIPTAVSIVTLLFWGRLVNRWGPRRVLLVAGLLVVNGGTAWILVTPDTKWTGYWAVPLGSAAWPGVELASAILLFRMSESGRDGRLGSAYVAVQSAVVAIAGTLSGLFGGQVAELLKGWHGSILAWPLTFHGVLFIISGFFRLVALGWVLKLQDPKVAAARTVA